MNGSMVSACCATSIPVVSAPSACPSKKTAAGRFRRRAVSCMATGDGDGDGDGLLWLPRRDVMLNGLSGVAAGLAWYPGLASGEGEDSKSPCKTADKVTDKNLLCTNTPEQAPCPPRLPATPTFDFEPARRVRRVRKAAHLLSKEEQEKYKEAVGRMKALPEWNPLSFAAQAAIHESYCDHYYSYHRQRLFGSSEDDDPPFDVHFSWLFAPWHRMYLYFYERALGQLIGDDTFALPYWNWDHPAGMGIPDIFKRSLLTISTPLSPTIDKNPLYNPNRNPLHENALIDLDYLHNEQKVIIPFKGTQDENYKALVEKNLCTVYQQQQLRGGPNAESFLGQKYCTDIGSSMGSQGSLEGMAHSAVHVWVGKAGPTPPATTCTDESGGILNHSGGYTCTNDMGFFGSSGRDPLFYSHHSNVDRLWHLWSTRFGGREGITDPDWLDTTFVFYDDVHNPRKVRIKFSDVLDTRDLGYTYDRRPLTDLPWLYCKLELLSAGGGDGKDSAPGRMRAARSRAAPAPVEFPLALTQGQAVVVPDVAVPPMEPGTDQVLVIEGIEFDPQENNKFDVAINVPADKALQVGPQYKEYAGTFAVVPGSGGGGTRQAMVSLCITNVLLDIEADGDSTVNVVIVPRSDAKVTLINVRPTIQNRE